MKIGTVTSVYQRENGFTDFESMKQNGFDCADHQWFINTETPLFSCSDAEFERVVSEEARRAASAGISIHQVHAPWACPPPDTTEELRQKRLHEMSRAVWGAHLLGGRYFVIHPIMPDGTGESPDPARYLSINREFFQQLLQVAASHGVVLCLENMPFAKQTLARPAEILDFVRSFDSPYFKMCLDTGHCAIMNVSPADAVRQIGKEYLAALHVHDNDGCSDLHQVPGTGAIDWTAFVSALKEIGYDGVFSFEVSLAGSSTEEKMAQSASLAALARNMIG